jgi:aerobic-type carbon monoxide dehydrogenase small subunit (CoxS/CutS family)
MPKPLTFTVNGQSQTVTTEPDRPLLELLREDLHLTGAKFGCGEGQCGACSILLNGQRVFSCKTPASKAAGQILQTIEGLATGDRLTPLQEAFLADAAFQCGYCTPGMIVAATALLKETPNPTDAQIRAGMNKNLCRCCSYSSILRAVRRAADTTTKTTTVQEVK